MLTAPRTRAATQRTRRGPLVEDVAEQLRRFVVVFRYGMCVPAERDARVGVAQAGLHGLYVYSVCEQHRGLGVPEQIQKI